MRNSRVIRFILLAGVLSFLAGMLLCLSGCRTDPIDPAAIPYPIDHGRIDPVTHEVPHVIR